MSDSVMKNLSEPISELTIRVWEELEKEHGRELSPKDVEDVSQERIDKAFLRVYSANPDGTPSTAHQAVRALREKYGGQISEEEYGIIADRYQAAIFNTNARRAILRGMLMVADPHIHDTAIGKYLGNQIKSFIEKSQSKG